MEQIEASINRYLSGLDATDRQEGEAAQAKAVWLKDKIAALKEQLHEFKRIAVAVRTARDQQISLTDPDARSMATSGKGPGLSATTCRPRSMQGTT